MKKLQSQDTKKMESPKLKRLKMISESSKKGDGV